jgi:hypothetical protein
MYILIEMVLKNTVYLGRIGSFAIFIPLESKIVCCLEKTYFIHVSKVLHFSLKDSLHFSKVFPMNLNNSILQGLHVKYFYSLFSYNIYVSPYLYLK